MTELSNATRPRPPLRGPGAGVGMTLVPDGYKWTALFISTLGMLMTTIDGSITLIALPDIFRGLSSSVGMPANRRHATGAHGYFHRASGVSPLVQVPLPCGDEPCILFEQAPA